MTFKDRVLEFVTSIPEGKVVSYGQAAAAAGNPRAARQVGGILRGLNQISGIPWWRVINNAGVISIKGNWTATKELQKKILQKEGIIIDKDFSLDMKKYRFLPKVPKRHQ